MSPVLLPAATQEERRPHGSAPWGGLQDPRRIPTTGARQAARAAETASQARRAGWPRQAGRGRQPARGDPGWRRGDHAGVRDHGIPGTLGRGPVAGGVVRGRPPGAVRGAVRGEAGRQAGQGQGKAGGRRAEDAADGRCPDRPLPGPRPAACRQAVVTQARAYPGAPVREVRSPGYRCYYLPGHQDQPHAGDRQRCADSRGG